MQILINHLSNRVLRSLFTIGWVLIAAQLGAQTDEQRFDEPVFEEIFNPNWQVEIIAFIHPQPDEAFRDRTDLDDYRDLPSLPAILTAAEPELPPAELANELVFPRLGETQPEEETFDSFTFATETMANAWPDIIENYQPIGYFRWQQPVGRGSWRRLHDDQPLSADDSLSLGPHFEFDGRIRITTDTIGYANLQLAQRTPLLLNTPETDGRESTTGLLWRTLKLDQQRRIQPERMEYFDSAGLGLLILISPPEEPEDDQEAPFTEEQ